MTSDLRAAAEALRHLRDFAVQEYPFESTRPALAHRVVVVADAALSAPAPSDTETARELAKHVPSYSCQSGYAEEYRCRCGQRFGTSWDWARHAVNATRARAAEKEEHHG